MQHQVAQAVSSIQEKGVNIDAAKMAGPTSTSNWLLPGLILVGDYPRGAKLAKLISAGVVHFVDLRSNGEDYLAASGEHSLLYTHFELQKRVSSIHSADITETALTFKGILASCILNNSIAYLHCTDGHNLTAIAMAGILAFVYGVSGMKATQLAAQLHGTRRDNDGVHQLFTANQRAFVKDLSTDSNSYPTHMFAPTGAGGGLQQVSQPSSGSSPTSGGGGSPSYAQRGAPVQMDASQLLYGSRPGTSSQNDLVTGGSGSQAPTPSRTPNSSRFEHTRGHGGGYTSINIFGGSDSSSAAADTTPTRKKGRAAVPGMTPEYPHQKTAGHPANTPVTDSNGNSPVRNHLDHQHHPTNLPSTTTAHQGQQQPQHHDPAAQNLGHQLDQQQQAVNSNGTTPTHVTPQRSASVQQQQQQPPQDADEADMPPPLGTYNSASHYGTSGLFNNSSNAPSPMSQQQTQPPPQQQQQSSTTAGSGINGGGDGLMMMGDRLASEEQVQLPPHIVPSIIDPKAEGKEAAKGPSATTNWVIRDQVLIGPSPNPDHKDFRYLVQQRFDTFVVLTEENDAMQYVPYYEQRARVRCDALHHPMKDGEPVSASQTQSFLSFIAELVERVRVGEKLYIHCHKGHGRSGMVAAALLAELYGLNGMKAVNLNSALHGCRDDTEDRESPDNQDQRLSIISLFS